MNVLMVCSEFAPYAKTGGLADAVTGLSIALAARGHDVRVLLPKYAHLPPAGAAPAPVEGAAGKHRVFELGAGAAKNTRGTATAAAKGRRGGPTVYLLDL